jgi:hypothetical protein
MKDEHNPSEVHCFKRASLWSNESREPRTLHDKDRSTRTRIRVTGGSQIGRKYRVAGEATVLVRCLGRNCE